MFSFLHAADIHLDSPLKGLERYEGAPVDEIRGATRRALENLVNLAVDRQVDFVLIAGDVYDGDWPDHNTGLFFVNQMARLRDADIPVVLIRGNHDAESKITQSLRLPDNVQRLGAKRAETANSAKLRELGVAVHGRSFAKPAETENLAVDYPAASRGMFNIGLLHTCLAGAEGHERYAPCTLDDLRSKEYDYWALGHIHQRGVQSAGDEAPVIFSGNTQGRHIREPGAKGCLLVEVDDRQRVGFEFQPLDVFRWETCRVSAEGAEDGDAVLNRFAEELQALVAQSDGLPLGVRVVVEGRSAAHRELRSKPLEWSNQFRAVASTTADGAVWVEKVKLRTQGVRSFDPEMDGPVGELLRYLADMRGDETQLLSLSAEFADLSRKLPAELVQGSEALGFNAPGQLRDARRGGDVANRPHAVVGGPPMKLLELQLRAFGPFTDTTLTFDRGEHGLHLVYGANEAGKSSALRALRRLLFGFQHSKVDDFVHASQDLRVGGVLQASNGDKLECVRRRGKKNTLRDGDDNREIDVEALTRMLGGIDEDAFQRRFGIDHHELSSGGQAILNGSGELGGLLFAAASGIGDLNKLQAQLVDEAGKLFKPSGKVPKLNDALAKFKEQRKLVKEARLPSNEWRQCKVAEESALKKLDDVKQRSAEQRTEKQRLQNIAEALPDVQLRCQLQEELRPLANAPRLRDDFAQQRLDVKTRLEIARRENKNATEELLEIEARQRDLETPEDLLQHSASIKNLYQELPVHAKAQHDSRNKLEIELRQAEANALERLRNLGRADLGLARAEELRLTASQRRRMQDLENKRQTMQVVLDAAEKQLALSEENIREAQRQLDQQPPARDALALARAVSQAQAAGDLDDRLSSAEAQISVAESQTQIDLQRLGLWSGSLEALERLPVPPEATIDRYEADLGAAEAAVKQRQNDLQRLEAEIREADGQIEGLVRAHSVPSEDELKQARGERDAGWQWVLAAWREGAGETADVREFIAKRAPAGDLAEAYARSVYEADEVGDRLRREAKRAADLAKRTADRDKLSKASEDEQRRLNEATEQRETCLRQWRDVWRPLGIEPLSPREMRSWLSRHDKLVAAAEALRRHRQEAANLQRQRDGHRRRLQECLEELGEIAQIANESFTELRRTPSKSRRVSRTVAAAGRSSKANCKSYRARPRNGSGLATGLGPRWTIGAANGPKPWLACRCPKRRRRRKSAKRSKTCEVSSKN